jgi:hypothetical protein
VLIDYDVSQARGIALAAHAGQVDKAGEPYYQHLDRVAARVSSSEAKIVAYLHDVLEDTQVTAETLIYAGIPPALVLVVKALTHRKNEPRMDYYARVLTGGDLAVEVKLADIEDNSDPARLAVLDLQTRERLEKKYAAARAALSGRSGL